MGLRCKRVFEKKYIRIKLPVYGEIADFKTLFKMLMEHSKQVSFNLVIDEFQEFYNINPSVYSDMQHLWDRHKDESHINLSFPP